MIFCPGLKAPLALKILTTHQLPADFRKLEFWIWNFAILKFGISEIRHREEGPRCFQITI
jgi:hypothetical protein